MSLNKHLTCLALLLATLHLSAQELTDVTQLYLQNPSFEQDDITKLATDATRGAYVANSVTGWNLSGSYGVSDIMTASATATDNNFGAPGQPSDGNQMYYIRNSWSTSTAKLLQSITIPAGHYQLTLDNKCVTASSHTARIIAGSAQTNLTFQSSLPSKWNTTAVDFEADKETSIEVGLIVDFGSGSGGSVLIDNFRLYQYPEGYVEPEDPTETDVTSPTEGVITSEFVAETAMKNDLLGMLAKFSTYLVNDYQACSATNSIGEACGCFKGESTMANNEAGVRTNADLSMICAFLVKYAKPAGVVLPNGVTYDKLEELAMKTLVFAYSTHKANKLKVCSGNNYWGSTSTSDAVWESSLWAMSVAYSAYFQWEKLTDQQKGYIYNMLKAECNYELYRSIPTGYNGDTKAEENGWEADILAATLGLFPNDELAPKWFERLREFAINSYSHYRDASNLTVIDPEYDTKTVADLYKGNNLYGDYTLQNHNLFHTSYQNVVMQELGEAALALKMFQQGLYGTEKWKTNALMHNNQEVMDSVMNWLALADGELAMPNGNDWSLFLYDQITSYSTQACFQRDANALTLENLAYKQIKARQTTTEDGSWLLRPDVQARRMGVEAHRVMMTYLMHDLLSTADLQPTDWEEFRSARSEAKLLPYQNVVRAYTKDRFSTFSWSKGLKSYTGYFAANNPDKNKIVVPYRANNTGNITGWYEVSGQSTNATPAVSGIYDLQGDGYVMNGELNVNGSTLNNRFAIYSTPGNAFIYLDYVTANSAATITAEKGGLLAISTDELTKLSRTLYYDKDGDITHKQLDGSTLTVMQSDWVNIDNELGVVGKNNKQIAFGDRGANNSIYTSKLYPMYNNESRSVAAGAKVDSRNLVYYSNINAEKTAQMKESLQVLANQLPTGWNGVIVADPNQEFYLLVSNFKGDAGTATLSNISCEKGAPIFKEETIISESKASATFTCSQNHSIGEVLKMFVQGSNVRAQQESETSAYITATSDATISVTIGDISKSITIKKGETVQVYLQDGNINYESSSIPSKVGPLADMSGYIVNPQFDEGTTGWNGSPTVNYSSAEKYNTTFDVKQTITGLPSGDYIVSVQGFYRDGTSSNAANLRQANKEALNATLYATTSVGTVSQPMMSIYDEAGSVGNVGVSQSPYGYIPNTMEQASFYFMAGLYSNSLHARVGEDGVLTIGVKKTATVDSDWCIFDNFQLHYIVRGDIMADGKVDVSDVTTLVNGILGKTEKKSNFDVNWDGTVDIQDVTELVNIILVG